MKVKFVEVTNGPRNWGKFCIMRFDSEFSYESVVSPGSKLLRTRGWAPDRIIVFDLETNEGAAFRPGGMAKADLEKHKVWVCPMFEPFLEWLYKQDLTDLDKLPALIDLPDAEFQMSGYRRPGAAVAHTRSPDSIVHILDQGVTLCGMKEPPKNWPKGHVWLALGGAKDATCVGCKKNMGP
jgi:uncharacterized Zn-finger protein